MPARHMLRFWLRRIRYLYRCSMIMVLWAVFFISSLLVILAYLYLLYDESGNQSGKLGGDSVYPNDEYVDEERSLNLVSDKLADTSRLGVEGWWMPHIRWNQEIDCRAQQSILCTKVLTVACKPDNIRAIYQYLPMKRNRKMRGIYFSVQSASIDMQVQDQMVNEAMYSAIVLMEFMDSTTQKLRLDFPGGTHSYLTAKTDYEFKEGKQIQSLLLMLGCHGYTGIVKFGSVTLEPMLQKSVHRSEVGAADFLAGCPLPLPLASRVAAEEGEQLNYLTEELLLPPPIDQIGDEVSLAIHVSMDRIQVLEKSVGGWEGPVSLALFVPTKSKTLDTAYQWKKQYIKKKLEKLQLNKASSVTVVFANTVYDDYPINYMRNLAIKQVKTEHMLLLDADFVPAPNLAKHFKSWRQESKTAFVVPAFEFVEGLEELPPFPETKEELKEEIFSAQPKILPFRMLDSPEAHRPTDYRKWYVATAPYPIAKYQDKYEPYIIVRKTEELPLFDESFRGYGMNKVTHIMELVAAGYQFLVLPDVWAIHIPHQITSYNQQFLQNPLQRLENRATRFKFVAETMRKYSVGPCKGVGSNRLPPHL